jgi:hypothetical protein
MERLPHIAFLFGGIGDGEAHGRAPSASIADYFPEARHGFASLITAFRRWQNLRPERKKKFKMHMTWLDIHAGVIARDLILLSLVDQLVTSGSSMTAVEVAEVKATIMYIFIAPIMPPYCLDMYGAFTHYVLEEILADARSQRAKPHEVTQSPTCREPAIVAVMVIH